MPFDHFLTRRILKSTYVCEVKILAGEAGTDYKPLIEPYRQMRGGIIEALHALMRAYHFIPPKALKDLAKAFRMTEAEVYGVASFYSYFTTKEQGAYVIRVCRSAPCHLENAQGVMELLEKELGIHAGQTTEDGKFTLEWTECVGQCAHAPVYTINREPVTEPKNVFSEQIPLLLEQLRQN